MIYFTSDTHFFHRNVIKYCKRPYATQEEMHAALIANWNSLVKPEDVVYVLGDFAFCGVSRMREILNQLNGTKYLVPGNHDGNKTRMIKAGFIVMEENETFYWAGRKFNLSHYPYAPTPSDQFWHKLKNFWKFWRRKKYNELRFMDKRPVDNGRWLLHGHVHCAWKIKRKQINVGVDVWNYTPVSIQEISKIIRVREGIEDAY